MRSTSTEPPRLALARRLERAEASACAAFVDARRAVRPGTGAEWIAIAGAYAMFDGVSVVLRSTILQLATPDAMRGRVSAINGIFIGSSNELGAFYSGSMARLLGLVPSVVLGGLFTLGVVGVTASRSPNGA